MLTNQQKAVQDRRHTSQLTDYTNTEHRMSNQIQAAKATHIDFAAYGSYGFNKSRSLARRSDSVFSVDGFQNLKNQADMIKNNAQLRNIQVFSQRFQTPALNYGAQHPTGNKHTFSLNVLEKPQLSQQQQKTQSQMLQRNKSVLDKINYSQLSNQISNAQVFASPFLQKQRIIELTRKNTHSMLIQKKQVDPSKLQAHMKASWAITKDNHEQDTDQQDSRRQEIIDNLKNSIKNKATKEIAIWQQIRDQDSQHDDVSFYMTEQNYIDWQLRAKTPPSPTVSEKVARELAENTRKAQTQEKKQDDQSSTELSQSDTSEINKKKFVSLIKKKQKDRNQGEDLIDMIQAEHSENSLDEEEERKFAELKQIISNNYEERQTQFDYQTKKNLDYFGVVLPGTEKEKKEYQRQYCDTLMHKYRVSINHKKDFINNIKRNKGLTPLQKLQQKESNMLKLGLSGLRAVMPVDIKQKVFERVKDREEDEVYEERRNQSIEELLINQEMPTRYQLTEMQMKESLIQKDGLFVTNFSRQLLNDLERNPSMVNKDQRRDAFLMALRDKTLKMMQKNGMVSNKTFVSVEGKKIEKVVEEEQDNQKEIFYESRLKQNFYNSLKQTVFPCQDEAVNQEFQRSCYIESKVLGLPAMTKITQDGILSLVGYKLNSGLCQNLGAFLEKHTTANDPYIVRKLILDDNLMKDADLASLLKGISAQRRLESLSYSHNELGSQGLAQLKRLVEIQQEFKARRRITDEEAPVILSSLKFNCCKVIGDSLSVVSKMIEEIQLNLRSLRISDQCIGAAFPFTIEAIGFQQNLRYLNVSNSSLKPAQMVTLMNKLIELKTLRTLILSNNPVPAHNPNKTPNKTHQEFMNTLHTFMHSQEYLTLLNISNMFLGFESLLEFCHKAITPSLLSLHLSGNDITDFQMQMLLSAMGVSMRKFEQNREANAPNEIYVEVENDGTAELLQKMDKRNPENFVNVQKIVNSVACKQQILKHHEYQSNDGMGFGRIQTHTFDTQCTLNRGTLGDWKVVNNCFITNRHRYCVLFFAKDQDDHQQSFFQTILKTSKVTNFLEQQIQAEGLQYSKVPVILGGLALNRAQPMQEMVDYWDWIQNSLPQDYRLKLNSDDSYMRLKQEIVQKLAALGHMDPFLINAPSVQSEHNEEGLKSVLSNYFVFAGYVPPGKHSVLIKTRKTNKSYVHKNIQIEPNSFDYLGPFRNSSQPVDSFMRDWIFETHEDRLHKLTFLMEHWTAKEIFEDNTNKQQIVEVIARNYDFLRCFHLELATRTENSFFPFIQLQKWAQMMQGSGLFVPNNNYMHSYSLGKQSSSFNILLDQEILSVPAVTKEAKEPKEFICGKSDKCLIIHQSKQKQLSQEADPDNSPTPHKQSKLKLATGERYSNSFKKFIIADTVGFIQNIIKTVQLNNSEQNSKRDVVNAKNLQDTLDKLANLQTQLNSKMEPHLEISTLRKDKDTHKIYSVNFPHIVNLFLKLTSSKRRFNYDSISKLVTAGVNEATLQDCFFRAKMFSQEPVVFNLEEHQQWLKELDFTEFQVFLALAAYQNKPKPTKANLIVSELELAQKVQNLFEELFKVHLGIKPPAPGE